MGDPQKKIIKLFSSQPKDSLKDELKEILSESKRNEETKEKRKKQRKSNNNSHDGSITKSPAQTTFNIENNNANVIGSVGDNARFYSKTTKVIKAHTPDTIGADGHKVKILNDSIKELAETRANDFVNQGKYPNYKAAIGPVHNGIKQGFKSFMERPSSEKRTAINIIKEQNVNRFDEILNYFKEKLSETVTGKIKGAMKKPTSGTPFYMLMKRENDLLAKIEFKANSPEVYAALERYYGVSSHKELHPSQHKDWISYIERIVDKVEKGELGPCDIKF